MLEIEKFVPSAVFIPAALMMYMGAQACEAANDKSRAQEHYTGSGLFLFAALEMTFEPMQKACGFISDELSKRIYGTPIQQPNVPPMNQDHTNARSMALRNGG